MAEYASYAWLITHDSIADDNYPVGSYCNALGVTGPHDADKVILATLHRAAHIGKDKWKGSPVHWFKMYDDDGELYYSGVYTDNSNELGEEAFGPLEDFGTPNAGATEIRYYNPKTKEWDTL